MKRRKGPLRERLSSAKGGSLKGSTSSLHHKRMLNLNNLNILLKKEERLNSSKPSPHPLRSSLQTKKNKINQQLFMNYQESGEIEHSLQIALLCQKQPDSMAVIEKAIESGPVKKSRTINNFYKIGPHMVQTPTVSEKVFEKENPFIPPVKSEEQMKKKYSLNLNPSSKNLKGSMVVLTKPVHNSSQMSIFKPASWYKYYGHYQKKVKEMESRQKNQQIFMKKLNLRPSQTELKTDISSKQGTLPFLDRIKTEEFNLTSQSNLRTTTVLSPLHQTQTTQDIFKRKQSVRSSRLSTNNLNKKRSSLDVYQYKVLKERGYMPQACTFLGKTQLIAKNSPKSREAVRSFIGSNLINDPSF